MRRCRQSSVRVALPPISPVREWEKKSEQSDGKQTGKLHSGKEGDMVGRSRRWLKLPFRSPWTHSAISKVRTRCVEKKYV
jgi:hypothetical protein